MTLCPQIYKINSRREDAKTIFLYPAIPELFVLNTPLIVEIGPGRGDFLFHLAENNPNATVVGIEIKRKRVDKLISRIERRGLKNVRIIQDDARAALPRFFDESSVDEIHINFPDPWPKKRHAKNRAVNKPFLEECARALKKGGTISITTDHAPYSIEIAETAEKISALKSCYDTQIAAAKPDAYPTFFAIKWQNEGRKITYQKYQRV